ncbi:MAG: hypothetical protein Q8Q07_07805 [Dehalococcoidales bacterium]|nr:hypothetical protein [Dehalococcoidales bacterium]
MGGKPGANIIPGLLAFIGVFILFTVSCTSGQAMDNLPPLNSSEKGHPKLDSRLNQLVDAEKRGEAASFAGQSGIELVDGKVRVIIEVVPGQLETATGAATDAGAQIETSYNDLLQAVAPVTSLPTLADEESVRFIRLPLPPSYN